VTSSRRLSSTIRLTTKRKRPRKTLGRLSRPGVSCQWERLLGARRARRSPPASPTTSSI